MDFESDEDRLNRISNEINNGQYRMKRADVVTVPQQYSAQGKFNPVDGNAHLVREIDSEGNVTNFDRSGNPVEPTFGERLSKIWNTVKSYAEENPEIEFPAQTLAEAIGNTITSTAGSVADSVKEMPLYRSVFLTDEERLADAEKIGTAIGINPQILADNQGLYENAKKIYDKQQAMEITGGQLFSVPTIQEMYPEVNLSDPVQAAIALKNAREVIESREAVQSGSIADGIKNEWNFIKNTWTKGYEAGEAGSEIASIWGQEDRGEISLDEAVEKINELEKKAKLPENRGPAETILSETAMQIARNANSFPQALGEGVTYAATSAENILGIPKGTILKWMNTNMALPSFAKYLGNHVLNNPAAALAVNAKFAPSIFIGAFRDSYYDNYQRMRLATDAFGKHKYTKEEARRLAAGEASVQAAIEQKGVEIAFGPVFRILSKGPAAALISNAGAVKALLGAGKQAAARTAMKQAGVQFAKGAAAEIGEEGAQDLVSSIVENALGHEDNSFAEIIKSAGEAMLQAVPSVIGMMAPGAAVHGVGTYRGMKTISVQELKAAQEEIKRENESSLLSRLMELKKSSKLFQKSPESYRTTLQNQMNQAGMGTIYIDAQAAAQNEATHEALNNLVSSGAVTAKELNQAITTGKPLEVKSGKYMQTATPEMNEALSDYTTMDKGERTMHAIREERQRNQDLVDLVRSSQKEREAKAGKAILDKYFPDTSTEEGKEDRNTMVELLTGGLSDIKTNVKNALEAALKDWGDLTGVKDIQDYMKGREGVFDKTASEKGVDTVSLDRDTMIRISKNPGWYQDFYKSYGRAPNARELYDIAHRKMEDEVYYNLDKNDAEGMAEKEAMESAKRRVESLERVKDIVDKFDDKDIVAQSLLDPETYEQVYKPTVESLSKGNAAVNKSARDSALILSKMAENFHKNYGLPLKMAAVKVANDIGNNSGLKQMTRKEQSWVNSRLDQLKNYQRQSEREKELEKFKRSEPVTIERKDRGEYKGKPATEIPKLFRAKYPNGIEVETKIGTVKITARGIKNSLSHGMSQAKIDATFTLSDGLKNAAYMGSLPDKDGKPIINHFFAFKANYEGKPYIVVCRARETTTADNFYVHEIYLKEDIEKAEQSVSRDLANSRLSWGPALLYTSIIRQFLNGRNINSRNEYHQIEEARFRENYFQTAVPDLVVTHNTTEGKLEKTIQLGGFPMPSLGISKKGMKNRLEGFGEITLLGNRDMVDPRKSRNNDVFSRDAYTVRKPAVNYEEPSEKDQLAFYKKYKAVKDELGEKGIDAPDIDFSAYDGEQILNRFNRDPIVRYYYIKNVLGKDVPVKKITIHPEVRNKRFFDKYPEVLKALKSDKIREGDYSELDKATKPYFDHLQNLIDEKKGLIGLYTKRLRKMTTDGHINKEGAFMLWKWMDDYEEDVKKKSYDTVDKPAFQKDTDRLITEAGIEKFNDYIQKEFESLYKEKYLWDKGKKYKFTLANIVKLMKKDRGADSEGAPGNYGFNSLLAYLSRKFTSIRDIKKNEGMLQPNEKELAQYKKTEAMYTDLLDEAAQLRGKYDESIDTDLAELIKDVRDEKTGDMHGFPENKEFMDHVQSLLKGIEKVTTDYFEAKPARAVSFSEFSGAVVPENTNPEIIRYLENQGIAVETYDPKVEGEQKVKTEELAEKLNVYFQGKKYLGAYDRANNAIEIFDGANQSTVIHEGAHMYLSMLEEYSALSPAELSQYFNGDEAKAAASLQKMGNDLRTIREWAACTENHLKEYKGTGLEKEFTQYGKDIENGVEGAEERFMQERFARGFEKYLMDGSAPTKELRGVFRRFKSWLKDIYSAAKNLGNVKLTPEIKDIYDHMLATDKEVEAWAAQRKLDSIDKALNVNASEAENLKKWSEEVKEKAKEIALSYYMKTMKSDALDSFKKSIDTPEAKNEFAKKLAEENPFFKIEQILHSGQLPTKADRENFLKMNNYESEEEFNEAVKMMGGTTEEQYRKHIDSEIRNFKDNMLTKEDVRAMAENVLESPEGLQKRANLEAALLEKRVNQYINEITTSQLKLKRASDKAKAAAEIRERLGLITPEDKAEMGRQTERIVKNEEKISKLEDQVKKLKDQLAKEKEKTQSESKEKSSAQEEVKRLEGNIQAREKELEEERQQNQKTSDTLKDTEANVAELAVQLSDMVEGLKESRRAMKTDYKLMKDEAASTLGEETISHATSWKWWENKARIANARAMKAASQNNWEESAYQKNVEAQCLVMARTAKDNIEEIKRDLHGGGKLTTQQYNEEGMDRYGILGIINRIGRKEKPVLMNDDARYFVQHLAYMAGITKADGERPIDENGLSRNFDWHALGLELNPDLGIKDGKYDGFDVIPPWMKALFDSNTPMKFEDLKMNDYRAIVKAIKAVYKIGRREYEGNTLGTSFEKAATDIQDEIMTNWKQQKITPMDKELSATSLQRIGTKFHKLVRDITLPEIQIERLGEAAYKYIYIPIDKATAKRRQMKQDANKRFREIFDIYSRKEWTRMRSKKEFEYGTDPSGAKRLYTKEQVLSMALNMGTQSNRARLIKTVGGNEAEMLNFLDSVMDKRDWGFVTKIWEHVGEYWGERNKIQNDLYGTPMGKVPGLKFTLKSGQVIHGQYYPIKYDHKTSSRSNEYFANNIASMDLQGISAFSLGMGSTKARENGSGGQKLRLDLDVYVSHISEAIQHVSMREATVDVFKLLSRKEVVSSLERTIGTEATNELRQWVSDNWHSSIIEMNEWEKGVNRLRHKFVFATMGYRLSTALLNVLNIFGMMERMGTYNALKATSDFYFGGGANKFRNIKEQYQFIISKSTFMRERAATMDRDMAMGDRIQVEQNEWEWSSKVRHGKYGIDTINSGAFKIIALTDEMFSLPEWLATYKGALAKMQSENSKMTMEEMDQEAIRLADKAVRETFGSGEMKDQTSFMRKGGNLAGLTTFFSYTNLVTNQFIRAGYALYDYHTVKPLLRATFFWWILNSFFETCLREMWDDSDDPDKWKKKLLYTFASGGPLGGIPILRDILPPTVNFITKGGKGPLLDVTPDVPAFDSVKYFGKALQSIYKGDAIETGRNFSKGLTRVTSYTLPDTLVDGYWNFMRMISSDNLTFTDWIYKSMFDKPLKEKK